MSNFSIVVIRSPENREIDEHEEVDLNRSLTEIENTISHSQGDYEVVAKLPELPKRMDFPRLRPLTLEQWRSQINCEGVIEDVDSIKNLIFRGVRKQFIIRIKFIYYLIVGCESINPKRSMEVPFRLLSME